LLCKVRRQVKKIFLKEKNLEDRALELEQTECDIFVEVGYRFNAQLSNSSYGERIIIKLQGSLCNMKGNIPNSEIKLYFFPWDLS
jgi:hypothetical protein